MFAVKVVPVVDIMEGNGCLCEDFEVCGVGCAENARRMQGIYENRGTSYDLVS